MEPATLTAGAIATLVLIKATETATEKATEKLGQQVVEKGGKLLSLLKSKSPSTAKAIELSQKQPLDYNQAVFDLQATMKYPEVVKSVEEVDTAIKADPKVYQTIQAYATVLKSQPPTIQNLTNIIEKVVNFTQGHGASTSIQNQNITI
jgi:hypothetical protein